jgi:hypothetical protein
MAKSEDHVLGPGISNMVHEQARQKNQYENATHPLNGRHARIFNIQPCLLAKTIGVFDLRPETPLGAHGLGLCHSADGDASQQDEITVAVWVVGHQSPQHLVCIEEPNHQAAQFDVHVPHLAGVGEGDTKLEGQRHRGREIIQQRLLPESSESL